MNRVNAMEMRNRVNRSGQIQAITVLNWATSMKRLLVILSIACLPVVACESGARADNQLEQQTEVIGFLYVSDMTEALRSTRDSPVIRSATNLLAYYEKVLKLQSDSRRVEADRSASAIESSDQPDFSVRLLRRWRAIQDVARDIDDVMFLIVRHADSDELGFVICTRLRREVFDDSGKIQEISEAFGFSGQIQGELGDAREGIHSAVDSNQRTWHVAFMEDSKWVCVSRSFSALRHCLSVNEWDSRQTFGKRHIDVAYAMLPEPNEAHPSIRWFLDVSLVEGIGGVFRREFGFDYFRSVAGTVEMGQDPLLDVRMAITIARPRTRVPGLFSLDNANAEGNGSPRFLPHDTASCFNLALDLPSFYDALATLGDSSRGRFLQRTMLLQDRETITRLFTGHIGHALRPTEGVAINGYGNASWIRFADDLPTDDFYAEFVLPFFEESIDSGYHESKNYLGIPYVMDAHGSSNTVLFGPWQRQDRNRSRLPLRHVNDCYCILGNYLVHCDNEEFLLRCIEAERGELDRLVESDWWQLVRDGHHERNIGRSGFGAIHIATLLQFGDRLGSHPRLQAMLSESVEGRTLVQVLESDEGRELIEQLVSDLPNLTIGIDDLDSGLLVTVSTSQSTSSIDSSK